MRNDDTCERYLGALTRWGKSAPPCGQLSLIASGLGDIETNNDGTKQNQLLSCHNIDNYCNALSINKLATYLIYYFFLSLTICNGKYADLLVSQITPKW